MSQPTWGPLPAEAPLSLERSWRARDLSAVLAGDWQAPVPTVGRRTDGVGLFYPGKLHTISSESEAGKTWLCLSAVRDELDAGNSVVYIDFEDDDGGIVGRLLTLGTAPSTIAKRFKYVRPTGPIATGIHLDDLRQLLGDVRPTLAVLDGVTEAMTLHGLDPNSNQDAARFGRLLPRHLTSFGAASVALDHVTKSREGSPRYSIGAVHKLNGLDGAAYVLENRTPFGIGQTGCSSLRIAKDRPGQLRRRAEASEKSGGLHRMGDLVLTSHAEDFAEVCVLPPTPEDAQTRGDLMQALMDQICDHLAAAGEPLSGHKIERQVRGKAERIRAAVKQLVQMDLLSPSPHRLLVPWPSRDSQERPSSLVPPSSRLVPDEPSRPSSLVPPFRGDELDGTNRRNPTTQTRGTR